MYDNYDYHEEKSGFFSFDDFEENQNNLNSFGFDLDFTNAYSNQFAFPSHDFVPVPFHKDIPLNEENEQDMDINQIKPKINDEDRYSKKTKNQKVADPIETSTRVNSDPKDKSSITKENKFVIEKKCPKYWRFDATKKYWKSKISQYAEEQLNKLIQNSNLPNELKIQIHKPNSLAFTANVTVKDNYNFLSYNLSDIFSIGKETEELQKQNHEAITKIFDYFSKFGKDSLSENDKLVREFLEMNYEQLIKKFYDSDEFIKFKDDYMTQYFDEGTKRQEGFSLLEDYGLIRVFKMLKKKRKRN